MTSNIAPIIPHNSFSDQTNATISFAVTSKYFSVYEAYLTELKCIGYKWNSEFNRFGKSLMETRKVVFVTDRWNGVYTEPMLSFSNVSKPERVIDLDRDFEFAVQVAIAGYKAWKEQKGPEVVLNSAYTARVTPSGVIVGCQTFGKEAMQQLFDAAKKVGLVK